MTYLKDKIIELKNVGIIYKKHHFFRENESYQALKSLTFDVFKGEVLGIVGRNGAGKSSLLRLLAGIIRPDQGEIIHHTQSVSLMALAAGFDLNLSGRQNALMSGILLGYRKKEIIKELENIKRFSELQDFFEKPAKTYSSGMRARLAFSIAMYVSPDVLLIDEVLGVGDVSFKQKAEIALEEKLSSDITVIIVSHSEQQISRLSERVIWIDGGRVRKEGRPLDIFPEYNLNSRFSTFNLKIVDYKKNDDFFFMFEQVEVVNDEIKFRCILIDKKNRSFISVNCNNNEVLHNLSGPTPTPAYKSKYPDMINAGMARFSNGYLRINVKNEICVNIDSEMISVVKLSIERS